MPARRDPFRELDEFLERMNEQFGGIGRSLEGGLATDVNVDVADRGEEIIVTADLPGFDRDDIEVRLDDGTLVIDAEYDETESADEDEAGVTYHRRERRHRSINRRISLPADVVPAETNATYSNGVLTVTLPKTEPDVSGGKRIDIE
ncbi:MAG: Hsp20/alpha crystallin family protein [Halobacteriota archaeon]